MKLFGTLAASLLAGAAAQEWQRVDQIWAVMLGVATTPDPDTLYLPTGDNGVGFGVSKSTDGGQTFTNLANSSGLMWLDISANSVENAAVTGPMSTGKYTLDGESMEDSSGVRSIAQSIEAFGESSFGVVGQNMALVNGGQQGVAISNDSGMTYTWHNIPCFTDAINPETGFSKYPARYGAFPSSSTWYVTAGRWGSSKNAGKAHLREVSSHITLDTRANKMIIEEPSKAALDGYYGAIAKTTDGGATWELQHTVEGEYFNAITCSSVERCFAVSEGGGSAHIWHTEDGGETWTRVHSDLDAGASLMGARFHGHDEMEGWAAGGTVVSAGMEGRFWHTTDGGKTWTKEGAVPNAVATSLELAGPGRGYAGCITRLQVSTLCYLA